MTTEIDDFSQKSNAIVFPNPSQGQITVEWGGETLKLVHYELMDMQGQIVAVSQRSSARNLKIDLPSLHGIYYLRVRANNKQIVSELVLWE